MIDALKLVDLLKHPPEPYVMPEHIVVLAGNEGQFDHWRREHGYARNDKYVRYGGSSASLRGRYVDRVVVIGTFWDRHDSHVLYELAQYAVRPGMIPR